MTKLVLVIFDADASYAGSLASYLQQQMSLQIEVMCFSKSEAFREFYFAHKSGALLLLASESALLSCRDFDEPKMASQKYPNLIPVVLSESGAVPINGFASIDKYQSKHSIYRELMKILSDSEILSECYMQERVVSPAGSGRLFCFFSPQACQLQTDFALAFGELLSAQKSKSVYISTRPFDASFGGSIAHASADILDLICYSQMDAGKFRLKLESALRNDDGLLLIAPAFSHLDISKLESRQWIDFFDLLFSTAGFENIILDASEVLRDLHELMSTAFRIISVQHDDEASKNQLAHFECLLSELGYAQKLPAIDKVFFTENCPEAYLVEDRARHYLRGLNGNH